MLISPCKIDWDAFCANFPTTTDTWTINLEAGDFQGLDEDYHSEAFFKNAAKLYDFLPVKLQEPFLIFICGTTWMENRYFNLDLRERYDFDPREMLCVNLPARTPEEMKVIFNAVNQLDSAEFDHTIEAAWEACNGVVTEEDGDSNPVWGAFTTADELIFYMRAWFDVFRDLEKDKCVLGFVCC